MKVMMAPMEGVGGYVYRNAFEKYFGPLDGYVTPFVGKGTLMNREKRDLDPANNKVGALIPQIMGGGAEGFIKVSREVAELGYTEANINLGCPSGTVTGRGRGSGMLQDAKRLDEFLSEVFEKCPMKLSVKTRIGFERVEDWEPVLEVLKKYPWESVTIHPRTRTELYQGPLHHECFKKAYEELDCPLYFNGEINSLEDIRLISAMYPNIAGVMIGRGFLRRPWLANEIRGEKRPDGKLLLEWHRELTREYEEYLSGDKNLLFKLKDLWNFLGDGFPEKADVIRKMKKTTRLAEFIAMAEGILRSFE